MTSYAALAPLRVPGFALVWSGLALSVLGDGIYIASLAAGFAVLDDGARLLAVSGGAFFLAQLVLMLPGGVAADRYDRAAVSIVGTAVKILAVTVMILAIQQDSPSVALVAAAAGVLGAADALSGPALVPDLVGDEHIVGAIALRQFADSVGTRMLGPLLGGLIVAASSVTVALAVDAVTFAVLAVLVGLGTMASRRARGDVRASAEEAPSTAGAGRTSLWKEVREGLSYVAGQRWLVILIVASTLGLLATFGAVQVAVPLLVADLTGGSAPSIGLALAFAGLGGVVGSLVSSSLPQRFHTVPAVLGFWGVAAGCVALFGVATASWQVMVLMAVEGCSAMVGFVVASGLMMSRTPVSMRGRVSSVDEFLSGALVAPSFALAGLLASSWSVRGTLLLGGLVELGVVLLILATRSWGRLPLSLREGT